jgi:hypothetical protein
MFVIKSNRPVQLLNEQDSPEVIPDIKISADAVLFSDIRIVNNMELNRVVSEVLKPWYV